MSISRCLVIGLFLASAAGAAERPNFLFIYTDDQRWDALGVVGRDSLPGPR